MVVGPSAIAAVLLKEPESNSFRELLGRCGGQLFVPGCLESSIALTARGVTDPVVTLGTVLFGLGVEVVSFTLLQTRLIQRAYLHFGRSSGHPARLSFGDCINYALARNAGELFLFKGNDFVHTGLSPTSGISPWFSRLSYFLSGRRRRGWTPHGARPLRC